MTWSVVERRRGPNGSTLYTVRTDDGRRTVVQVRATVTTLAEVDAILQAAVEGLPAKLPEGV